MYDDLGDANMKTHYLLTALMLSVDATNAFGLSACTPSNSSCSHCSKYICNVGYYGESANGSSGCYQCPDGGTTTSTGTTTITGCYLKTGTYGDETGTFTISAKCDYTMS